MKITRAITIDIDVWSKARLHYDNLSERINDLLIEDLKLKEKPENVTPKDVERLENALSAMRNKLNEKEKEKEEVFDWRHRLENEERNYSGHSR